MKKILFVLAASVLIAACQNSNSRKDLSAMSMEERIVYYLDEMVDAGMSDDYERFYELEKERDEWANSLDLTKKEMKEGSKIIERYWENDEDTSEYMEEWYEEEYFPFKLRFEASDYFDKLLTAAKDDDDRAFDSYYNEFYDWYTNYTWSRESDVNSAIRIWINTNPKSYRTICDWVGRDFDFFYN